MIAMHEKTQRQFYDLSVLISSLAPPPVPGRNGLRENEPTVVFTQSAQLPTYNDDDEKNPVKFIEELESYFRKVCVPEDAQLAGALEALEGPAQDWVTIYRVSWRSYGDFKRDFLRSFWSD